MTMEKKDKLKEAGIDVEEALERFLGNEDLYLKFLLKFPKDDNFSNMEKYLKQNNCEEAYKCAHSIKGVAGNLSIFNVYKCMSILAEYLKNSQLQDAKEYLDELKKVYEVSVDAIRALE